MFSVLWFAWRILIPIIGVAIEGGCIYGMTEVWDGKNAADSLVMTGLLLAVMGLVAIIVFAIEGQFFIVYRIALPVFMGMLGLTVFFFLIAMICELCEGKDIVSELFGSMRFYSAMLAVGIFIVAETLWIALILLIQGIPEASLSCLIIGGLLFGAALAITFFYWIGAMLVYFFAHYYDIFFIVLGSAAGGAYLVFLVTFAVIKRRTLKRIVDRNLDKYWRNAA